VTGAALPADVPAPAPAAAETPGETGAAEQPSAAAPTGAIPALAPDPGNTTEEPELPQAQPTPPTAQSLQAPDQASQQGAVSADPHARLSVEPTVPPEQTNPAAATPATGATPATRATPATPETAATPATPATAATAATPATGSQHAESESAPEHPARTEAPSHPSAKSHAPETAERPQTGSVVSEFVQTAHHATDSIQFAQLTGRDFGQAVAATAHAAQQNADVSNPLVSAPVPLESLAVEIAVRAQAGRNRFEIRLDPPELGRIDVRLDIDRSGQVTSRLVVERAETLDVLRRDAHQLERALQDAGLKTSDNSLQFSLRDQAFTERNDRSASDSARTLVADPERPATEGAPVAYGLTPRGGGGIDIRV
jgi:flagellar hook-length control protein FliK